MSSTPNSELSSDYSITFSDDSEDVISDISIYDIANTRNINSDKMLNSSKTQEIENITAEQNIINQEFKITDETFLETMGYALNYFSNELLIANDKPQEYRQNLTKNVILFRQVIKDFEKDIEKRRGML